MRKVLVRLIGLVLLLAVAAAGMGYGWVKRPFTLHKPVVDVVVAKGDGASAVAQAAVRAGVQTSPALLSAWLRVCHMASRGRHFKAGSYEVTKDDTPWTLVRKLQQGVFATRRVRVGEGWTFKQMRTALRKAEHLAATTAHMSDAELMAALGMSGQAPEGMFFPDTYQYNKNSPDLDVYRMALRSMQRKLDAAWQSRAGDLPLQSPYELLTLASIVEKETGHKDDRGKVAAVFANRLKIGMRLQTDPTVIYGMGAQYQGRIRRKDLETDTPFNTYTRAGLPPTPIALPSEAALAAAANPADSDALYFVARGDGTSEFSNTLAAHNRAVDKYIRRK